MRRLISLIVLLTSGWSQYSVTHCAMALSAKPTVAVDGIGSVAVAHPHAHGQHAQSASQASPFPASTHSAAAAAPSANRPVDTGCPLVLACTSAALNTTSQAIAASPAASDGEIRIRAGDHDTVPLTRDPPPPRLPV